MGELTAITPAVAVVVNPPDEARIIRVGLWTDERAALGRHRHFVAVCRGGIKGKQLAGNLSLKLTMNCKYNPLGGTSNAIIIITF